jgi:hypothetical protein
LHAFNFTQQRRTAQLAGKKIGVEILRRADKKNGSSSYT